MNKKLDDLFQKCQEEGGFFGELRLKDDHYYTRPPFDSLPGPHMQLNGQELLVWSVNDYLGFTNHPEVRAQTLETVEEWGVGAPMGARMLTGNTKTHIELEQKIADFVGKEAGMTHNLGYLGMLATVTAMAGRGDTVIIDSLAHSCIVDAAILAQQKSGQRIRPFKHNDLEHLERQLSQVASEGKGGALIVTEGVFGMHGDLGDLPGLCALKEKYNARLLVDDAHGFGVMGDTGRGTPEHFNVQNKVDLYFSTFSKALASIGGFTCGPKLVIDYMRYNAKQSITSRCMPMAVAKTVISTLDFLQKEPERRDKTWAIAQRLQNGLENLGYNIGDTQSPITPVHIPVADVKHAMDIVAIMRDEFQIFVSAITYPIVPPDTALIRLVSTARHTEEDVDITLKAFEQLRDKLELT